MKMTLFSRFESNNHISFNGVTKRKRIEIIDKAIKNYM